ncbi:hypothetical protein CEW89_08550 [Celeribacter ethanolicus]|uniref:Uncharacterized protein n=1 Tax=Celeribacter ethanolicus TaxID=1758178 RepID=A0A291GB43_9RHOB|nr:hypothetical protein [Celeribacter ethanolicus]ATG47619.1 hypothetical protein CEW89_08550 [Celeribacter ethanolicus]
MIGTITHTIADHEAKGQIIRAALSRALAGEIILSAMEHAPPQMIEDLFTTAGGSILQDAPGAPASVFHLGIEEYHTSQAHLAIYLWAERAIEISEYMEIADPLTLFVGMWMDAPLDKLSEAIRACCDEGMGNVNTPPAGQNRTGTHLFEIDFLGVNATGFTEIEAAKNWRTAAISVASAKEAA